MESPAVFAVSRSETSRRLTRRAVIHPATLFEPQDPSLSPEDHFPLQTVLAPDRTRFPRFINRFDSREILLVVSGLCVNNGRHADKHQPPTGGCSFIFKGGSTTGTGTGAIPVTFLSASGSATPTAAADNNGNPSPSGGSPSPNNQAQPPPPAPNPNASPQPTTTANLSTGGNTPTPAPGPGGIAFPLETHGPSGQPFEPTSNRAKLRAVIAALQFRAWGAEGWRRVVVLTDLEYIVWGATQWLPRWVARRWRKPFSFSTSSSRSSSSSRKRGRRYENRDLWEALQGCVEELRGQGCEVSFWLVKSNLKSGEGKEGEQGKGKGGIEGVVRQAKIAAQRAAREVEGERVERFTRLCGVMV